MEQRNLSALLLSMAVLLMWQQWRVAQQPPVEAPPVEVVQSSDPGSEAPTSTPPVAAPVLPPAHEVIPERTVAMNGCGASLQWNTLHGTASDLELLDWDAPQGVNEFWRYVVSGAILEKGLAGWQPYGDDTAHEALATVDAQLLSMGSGRLDAPSPASRVVEEGPDRIVLSGTTDEGIQVTRRVVAGDSAPCVFDVELTWTNLSGKPYSGGLWMGMHDAMSGSAGYYSNVVRPHAMTGGSVEAVTDVSKIDEPQKRKDPVQWFGLGDRYFMAALVPQDDSEGRLRISKRVNAAGIELFGEHFVVDADLAPGEQHTESMQLYVGPMDYDAMALVDEDLAYIVKWQYGWFAFFCFPLLWLLRFFHGVLGNWGLAIIALTVFVKAITFPLTQASFRSGQAMQAIQPQLQEIRERYKDEPEKLNQEMLRLFQENGVNPVGGCLPMLVQMPVWFALFRVLLSSVDLYHTDFLYIKDLSVADPFLVLPVLAMATTMAQQRMMPQPANMDPAQAKMLKAMPLVFGFFYFAFPAGLVLYIFVNMILTTAQQWLIRRQFESAAVPASAGAPN